MNLNTLNEFRHEVYRCFQCAFVDPHGHRLVCFPYTSTLTVSTSLVSRSLKESSIT